MIKNKKGAIFDLDGTLVDSMWVWTKIDMDYLKLKGCSVPENLKAEISHLSFSQTADYIKKKFNLSDSISKILSDWHNMSFNYYANDIKLKDGVKEFLDKLKESNIKIALATSNSTPLFEACLKNNGIYHYFDSFTITDEVDKGKNFPDVYLLAASKLKLKPEECVVFEDILPAVQGAKAANMTVIAVYDRDCSDTKEEMIKYADKYIHSFNELL